MVNHSPQKRGNGKALDAYFDEQHHQNRIQEVQNRRQGNYDFKDEFTILQKRRMAAKEFKDKQNKEMLQIHNIKIFNKIQGVLKTKGFMSCHDAKGPQSLNNINRKHDSRKIDRENMFLKSKIMNARSNYS